MSFARWTAKFKRGRGPESFGAGDIESRLVWILGSPRSGSTWLLKMLGEHEAVVSINEPLIGAYLGAFLADLRGVGMEWFDSTNFTLRRFAADNQNHFFAEGFRDVWLPWLGELMRQRFLAHALAYPAKAPLSRSRVVIQEPNGSQSADLIMGALPRSRFIFLLRDGRDVIDSQLAANNPGGWVTQAFPAVQGIGDEQRREFLIRSAHKWLWTTEVVQRAFAEHPGPKCLLRYEDLLGDTSNQVRRLLDWLELDCDAAQLGSLIERHSFQAIPEQERGAKAFVRAATPGLWRRNLSADEQETLQRIIGPKLLELGYADAGPA